MSKLGLSWVDDTVVGPYLEALNLNKITGAIEDANTYYPVSGTDDLTVSTANGNYVYAANLVINMTIQNANTGAMTVNIDSAGVTDLLDKDGNAFGGGDFEPGQRVTFVRNSGNTAFTLAPKDGAGIKLVERGETILSSGAQNFIDVTIPALDDTSKSYIEIDFNGFSAAGNPDHVMVGAQILNSTTIRLRRNTASATFQVNVSWKVIVDNNIKNKQTGVSADDSPVNIPSVDLNKTRLINSFTTPSTTTGSGTTSSKFLNSSNIQFTCPLGVSTNYWQIIEY